MAGMPLFLVAALVSSLLPSSGAITVPAGFREGAHVKSAIVLAGHPAFATEGGIHHIYANPAALAGYRSGRFADGAVIVYELLETREADGVMSEGPRRRID